VARQAAQIQRLLTLLKKPLVVQYGQTIHHQQNTLHQGSRLAAISGGGRQRRLLRRNTLRG
jgi:hypothetical protein